MVKFGKPAAQWEQDRETESQEVWIRGMKKGENKLRILDNVDEWVAYREHYDTGINYFPCAKEAGEPTCVGCSHPSEKVRDRTRKFAFNAWDDKDELRLFKVGKRVYDTMIIRKDRSEANPKTICDRDFIITKSGTGTDTSYDVEGLAPEVVEDDGERLDIYAALEEKYQAAVKWYSTGDRADSDGDVPEPDGPVASGGRRRRSGGDAQAAGAEPARTRTRARADTPAPAAEPDPEPEPEPAPAPAKATKATATRGRARAKATTADADEAQQLPVADNSSSNGDGGAEFAEMDKLELQAWLTSHDVEYAENAPRSVLVMLCEKNA